MELRKYLTWLSIDGSGKQSNIDRRNNINDETEMSLETNADGAGVDSDIESSCGEHTESSDDDGVTVIIDHDKIKMVGESGQLCASAGVESDRITLNRMEEIDSSEETGEKPCRGGDLGTCVVADGCADCQTLNLSGMPYGYLRPTIDPRLVDLGMCLAHASKHYIKPESSLVSVVRYQQASHIVLERSCHVDSDTERERLLTFIFDCVDIMLELPAKYLHQLMSIEKLLATATGSLQDRRELDGIRNELLDLEWSLIKPRTYGVTWTFEPEFGDFIYLD